MRLIDANKLETHEQLEPFGNGNYEYVEVVYKDDIDNAPTIEPKRIATVISDDVIMTVNGYKYHYEEYFCNICKKKVFSCDSYCSHCGAKLDWTWDE